MKTVFNALIYGMEVPIGRYIYILRNRILLYKEKNGEKFCPVLEMEVEDFFDLISNVSQINTRLLRKKYKTHDFKKLSESEIFEYDE